MRADYSSREEKLRDFESPFPWSVLVLFAICGLLYVAWFMEQV